MQRAVRTLHCGNALWDLPVFKLGRKLNTAAADMRRRQIGDQGTGSGNSTAGLREAIFMKLQILA